ncbi:MAG: RNA 3'-terminal phosphate cyclase [Thermoplasmatota archaeon]
MMTIDGSEGEGGGQILRTAAALSVHTGEPIAVDNIRSKRRVTGLRPQHVTALEILKKISSANASGLEVGADRIEFPPGTPRGGRYEFDIGTAGSITLVFETLILALFRSKKRFRIELTGGTDVKWSPPWDHFEHVYLPLIRSMGIDAKAELIRRGHHPRGGGKARLIIGGSSDPSGIDLTRNVGSWKVEGKVHLSNLPDHIARRMRKGAVDILMGSDLVPGIAIDKGEPPSTGTGIVLWARSENSIIGSSALGRKGFPAEKVGEEAANDLLKEIGSGATVDPYTMDQIVPFMAIAGNSGSLVRKITGHIETNVRVVERMLGVEFWIGRSADPKRIRILTHPWEDRKKFQDQEGRGGEDALEGHPKKVPREQEDTL